MDNANRPDRAAAGVTDTATTVDNEDDGNTTDRPDDKDASSSAAADAARAAAESHPANEFSGLDASGGPTDKTLSGNDSRNSHRGYGPDDNLSGGIDDGVNAGLTAADANHPANEFSGLGASGGPIDGSLAGGIDDGVNTALGRTRKDPDTTTPGDGGGATTDDGFGFAEGPPDYQFSGNVNDIAALSNGVLDAGAALAKHVSIGDADDIARALDKASRFAGPGGRFAGSAAETLEATMNAKPGEKAGAAAVGAVKSLDDLAVAAVGGFIGGAVGGVVAGVPTGGAAAPLGTGLGAAAGSTTLSIAYDGSFIDNAVDATIDLFFGGDKENRDDQSSDKPSS
ncbi:MAG: hypothetical protein AAGA21_06310 [Pseudomonadota bacterium]